MIFKKYELKMGANICRAIKFLLLTHLLLLPAPTITLLMGHLEDEHAFRHSSSSYCCSHPYSSQDVDHVMRPPPPAASPLPTSSQWKMMVGGLPNGASTSLSFTTNSRGDFSPSTSASSLSSLSSSPSSSSLNKGKFVSLLRRKKSVRRGRSGREKVDFKDEQDQHQITSYNSSYLISHVEWINDTVSVGKPSPASSSSSSRHYEEPPISNMSRRSNGKITPYETELIFVIANPALNPPTTQNESRQGHGHNNTGSRGDQERESNNAFGWTGIDLQSVDNFEKHINDPDFIFSSEEDDNSSHDKNNISLFIPLMERTRFAHLSVLCNPDNYNYNYGISNDHGAGIREASNEKGDGPRSIFSSRRKPVSSQYGKDPFSLNGGNGDGATDEIKSRFRLVSHLLKFSWEDYDPEEWVNDGGEDLVVWLTSCPPNINCMGEEENLTSSLSPPKEALSSPSADTNPANKFHQHEKLDHNPDSINAITASRAKPNFPTSVMTPTPTAPYNATTAPPIPGIEPREGNNKQENGGGRLRRLVKVSREEPFTVSHKCSQTHDLHSAAPFSPINPIYFINEKVNNKPSTSLLIVDMGPGFHSWFSRHRAICSSKRKFSQSFVLSLKLEEIHHDDSSDTDTASTSSTLMQSSSPSPHLHSYAYLKEPILAQGLRLSRGKEQALFTAEYKIDERCAIPASEACPVGKCSDAGFVYKFRSECSPRITGTSCNFEEPCQWKWEKKGVSHTAFRNTTPAEIIAKMHKVGEWAFRGPLLDSKNKTDGHFLLLAWENGTKNSAQYTLTSPWFGESQSTCYLEAYIHMHNMQTVSMKVVIESSVSAFVPLSKLGNGLNTWERLKQMIGQRKEPFRIVLEVDNNAKHPSYFAIDDIRLMDCFSTNKTCKTTCSDREFQCNDGNCIDRNRLCDLKKDCLNGEDEKQDCERLPKNSSCTFESGWCGWHPLDDPKYNITWQRTNKPSVKSDTGPTADHTFKNSSGYYLVVDMKVKNSFFHRTVLRSPVFARPPGYNQNSSSPYYQSCQLRFFYHMYGAHVGSLDVELVPQNSRNPWTKPYRFCERVGNQGNIWHRASCKIPSFKGSKKYYLQLTAIRGARGASGDIAIDDISLSPECFGFGVPANEVSSYNYDAILSSKDDNRGNLTTAYRFSSCNSTGRSGPSQEQCDASYNGTLLENKIKIDTVRNGVQIWTVPETKSYTLIAKGASGGRGALLNQMTSHGSIVKTTMFLRKGEQIYILVGQEGISGCEQANLKPGELDRSCKNLSDSAPPTSLRIFQRRRSRRAAQLPKSPSKVHELQRINNIFRGGGGGGGATIVFKKNDKTVTPILVAAGGGGLGYNASANILPHGRGLNVTLHAHSGITQAWGAGGGGGWEGDTPNVKTSSLSIALDDLRRSVAAKERDNATMLVSAGLSLIDGGGLGGFPCEQSDPWGAAGGFGGGGGGCIAGGGGGGYVGGNAHSSLSANGEGGWSYIGKGGMYPSVEPGGHSGPGEFVVIPSFKGCGCEHDCVLLDDYEMHSGCVCPENGILREDGISCVGRESFHIVYVVVLIVTAAVVFCVAAGLCFCLYNRYQRQKMSMIRRKMMGGPELQLSRLRAASGPGGVLTEYNPNYEFGGETYTLTDLKEIPRENLRLVKALGQGAFGEVYQGFYRHRDGDAVEMPVAVKTLPALSSNQAEMDFLMEALIMSKFNHPNIVHFIGVCFDKHPRFIILELLAGGDLKTFLRESRPKPDKGSPLTMRDLLLCALDVAKGTKYLEDNHFIHRDIAARNCLLTTKGPGRVVKIADFGMARDIYRADYYKKGGKAMLPVKWMPPEAFLDGIFTSKTDVWSYGVLLWEIFSLGYMPYPGRGNQDVMQLITNGGRLEPPSNCPPPVYGIMTQCWHPIPDERPNFSTLLERVGYCLQDPEVVNAPLPVFQRPPSSERDTTLMRPPNPENASCLRIVQGNRYSISTTPDIASPNSSTADYLVPLTHYSFSNPASPPPKPDSTPTSPTTPIPESESTETMLDEEDPTQAAPAGVKSTSSSKDSSTKYADITVKTGGGGSAGANSSSSTGNSSSIINSNKPNVNGIETGVTLSAAGLDKLDRSSGTKHPAQYANIGVSKPRLPSPVKLNPASAGGGNLTPGSDEEIRC